MNRLWLDRFLDGDMLMGEPANIQRTGYENKAEDWGIGKSIQLYVMELTYHFYTYLP